MSYALKARPFMKDVKLQFNNECLNEEYDKLAVIELGNEFQ